MSINLTPLQIALKQFNDERNWAKFHTPKAFACAAAAEVGELMEPFVWLKDEESWQIKDSPEAKHKVAKEMADVYINLLQLARLLEIDLEQAAYDKLENLKQRYPAKQFNGTYKKLADEA